VPKNAAPKPYPVSDPDVTHVVIELFGGDNNLSKFVDQDMAEMAAGNHGSIAMLGLADYRRDGGKVVEVTRAGGRRDIEVLGEIDTGDPETLATFLARALVTFPNTPHRALGFWDHGTGVFDEQDLHQVILDPVLRGMGPALGGPRRAARRLFIPRWKVAADPGYRAMLIDDTSGGILTNAEAAGVLRAAFDRSGTKRPFDLIFSDTCLNGMVEVLDEFQPFAEVIVGSEELEPATGWDYRGWYAAMSDDPPATAADWGRQAVEAFGAAYTLKPPHAPVTLAAFRARNAITARFRLLVKALEALGDAAWPILLDVRSRTQRFAQQDSYDLSDFVDRLMGLAGARVDAAATGVQQEVAAACVKSIALGARVEAATGLALWFPANQFSFRDTASTYTDLVFDRRTHWSAFLGRFLT